MEKSKEINYRKSSIPSGPGPQQITTVGQDSMKGGAPFVSQLPKEYVIPAGSSKNSGSPGK